MPLVALSGVVGVANAEHRLCRVATELGHHGVQLIQRSHERRHAFSGNLVPGAQISQSVLMIPKQRSSRDRSSSVNSGMVGT